MEQGIASPIPAAQTQPQPQPETPEVAAAPRPEPGLSITPQSRYNNHGAPERQPQTFSTEQPPLSPESDGRASQTRSHRDDSHTDSNHARARLPLTHSYDGHSQNLSRNRKVPTVNPGSSHHDPDALEGQTQHQNATRTCLFFRWTTAARRPSEIDSLPSLQKGKAGTIGERLMPTIRAAVDQREKFARKAKLYRYLINIAIGLQVLLGALTTGLATAVTTLKQSQVSTAILGGLATLVASFLARVRGSGEPELSIIRKKDLDHLLRDAQALYMDRGHESGESDLTDQVQKLRDRLEELLRKANDGGGKPSPGNTNNATDPKQTAKTTGAM